MRDELGKYMSDAQCTTCHGKRLKPEALSVRVADMDISVTGEMSIRDALARFEQLGTELSDKEMEIASRILKDCLLYTSDAADE